MALTHTSFLFSSVLLLILLPPSYASLPSLSKVSKTSDEVLWWVQVSDLHVSVHYPKRAEFLEEYLGRAVRLIKPSALLVTGDLTDAKNKRRTVTRQDENEWIRYRQVVEKLSEMSGLSYEFIMDVRGNHDTFEVPVRRGDLDFYSIYSVSSRLNRTVNSVVYSNSLESKSGRKHYFVSIDTAPLVGLRGPANFFGHPTDEDLIALDSHLTQISDPNSNLPPVILVMGHYPLSFVARSPSGRSLQSVFHKHKISAYIAGHLHQKFGSQMYRFHSREENSQEENSREKSVHMERQMVEDVGKTKLKNEKESHSLKTDGFWEWAAGDWKENFMFRVMACDNGVLSFTEVHMFDKENSEELSSTRKINLTSPLKKKSSVLDTKAVILVTYPPDSRFLIQSSVPDNSIRVLVFSNYSPFTVTAFIYDTKSEKKQFSATEFVLLESISLTRVNNLDKSTNNLGKNSNNLPENTTNSPLFAVDWNSKNYISSQSDRFWIQISVLDSRGVITKGPRQPFSIGGGGRAYLKQGWLERSLMYTCWEDLWPWSLRFIFGVLWVFLLLPKGYVLIVKLKKSTPNIFETPVGITSWRGGEVGTGGDRESETVTETETETGSVRDGRWKESSPLWRQVKSLKKLPFFFIWSIIMSTNHWVWWVQVFVLLQLSLGPWFWGFPLGEKFPIGRMSLWGWIVQNLQNSIPIPQLATPDILTMVIPFLYFGMPLVFVFISLFVGMKELSRLLSKSKTVGRRRWKEIRKGGGGEGEAILTDEDVSKAVGKGRREYIKEEGEGEGEGESLLSEEISSNELNLFSTLPSDLPSGIVQRKESNGGHFSREGQRRRRGNGSRGSRREGHGDFLRACWRDTEECENMMLLTTLLVFKLLLVGLSGFLLYFFQWYFAGLWHSYGALTVILSPGLTWPLLLFIFVLLRY